METDHKAGRKQKIQTRFVVSRVEQTIVDELCEESKRKMENLNVLVNELKVY